MHLMCAYVLIDRSIDVCVSASTDVGIVCGLSVSESESMMVSITVQLVGLRCDCKPKSIARHSALVNVLVLGAPGPTNLGGRCLQWRSR